MRRRWDAACAIAAAVCLGGCSDLPDVPGGACGNHVVEPAAGEECDDARPGCGAPATAAACRFTCLDDGSCRVPGSVCGRDRVCRQPTGGFTLSAPIGGPGDGFELVDADGDGLLDVLDRATLGTTLLRNDGAHGFTSYASGATLPNTGATLAPHAALGRAPGREVDTLLAAPTVFGSIGLYAVARPAITPVVLADSLVPDPNGIYVGAVVTGPSGAADLLYWDAGTRINAYSYRVASPAALDGTIDLARCGVSASPSAIGTSLRRLAGGTSIVALGIDGDATGTADNGAVCLAHAHPGAVGFDVLRLDLSPLRGRSGVFKSTPRIGDFNGDGLLDVAVRYDDATVSGVALVLGKPGGFLPVETVAVDFAGTGYNLAAGDFDGDHRDDLAYASHVYRSVPDAGMAGGVKFVRGDVLLTGVTSGAIDEVGDFDRDGHADLAVSSDANGNVGVCTGDGSGARFGCSIVATTLPALLSLDVGDVNGDGTDDVVGGSPGVAEASSVPDGGTVTRGSGIAAILGRPLTTPDPVPRYAPALGGTVVDLRPMRSTSSTSDNFLVALTTDDHREAIAFGVGDGAGLIHFDFSADNHAPSAFIDERFGAPHGSSLPDIALLGWDAIDVIHADRAGGYASVPERVPLPGGLYVDPDAFPRLVALGGAGATPGDLGDAAVTWAQSTGVFFERLADPVAHDLTAGKGLAPLDGPVFLGAVDLDQDGRDGFVYLDGGNGKTCRIVVARLAAGETVPTAHLAATIPVCAGGQYFFADLAPADGKLDLVMQLANSDRVLARGRDGATFDSEHLEMKPAFPVPPHALWVASRDLDGDGVVDVLMTTGAGAVVAWGDVLRR